MRLEVVTTGDVYPEMHSVRLLRRELVCIVGHTKPITHNSLSNCYVKEAKCCFR